MINLPDDEEDIVQLVKRVDSAFYESYPLSIDKSSLYAERLKWLKLLAQTSHAGAAVELGDAYNPLIHFSYLHAFAIKDAQTALNYYQKATTRTILLFKETYFNYPQPTISQIGYIELAKHRHRGFCQNSAIQ